MKHKNLDTLLADVDWKGISIDEVGQISHEVRCWYDDYSLLQKLRKLSGEDIGESFENKFNSWIDDRIQMVLDRE